MKIGYIRTSSAGKLTEDSQRITLQEAGCQNIFIDDQKSKDSELVSALKSLKDGDVLVVKGFVTLGKTIKGLVELINELHARSVCLVSIDDGVDTGTTEGRHLAHVMARLHLMDKALINERTHLSLAVGRAKGRLGGRPPALTSEQILEGKKLIVAGMSVRDVAKTIGSNQATIYRLVGANPI